MRSLLVLAAAGMAASAPAPCPAWTFFGGYNCANCTDGSKYGIAPHSFTQTGNECNLPGCKSWSQGSIPQLRKLANGSIAVARNGGVPQRANMTEHIEALRAGVVEWIPDPEYSGNAVFDFEAWTPIYESNDGSDDGWHWDGYRQYSEQLVREAHPDWNATRVAAAAAEEFQAAGVDFFVQTLQTVRELRPKARWGFYGFPANPYSPCLGGTLEKPDCGYNAAGIGNMYRAANDAIQAVFNASTALFPSIYLPPQSPLFSDQVFQYVNGEYVAAVTAEAIRLAGNAPPGIVVRPYAWAFYHNGTTTLSRPDTASVVTRAFQPPVADGVVLWGDSTYFKTTGLMEAWLTGDGGPAMANMTSVQCQCAASRCSGHGACDPDGGCDCVYGYTGPACQSRG